MAFELKRLIEKVKHLNISVIAGEKGTGNLVTWVHMVESTETSIFLEGGEIVFCTGIGISTESDLYALVDDVCLHKAAGMIFNIGPYIKSIPQRIIDYCNEKAFPLYIVPWKVHIAEIMRVICFCITKEDQKNLEIASAFKNAIFFPKQEELYLPLLTKHNFNMNWNYSVCTLDISSDTISDARLEQLAGKINHYLNHHYNKYALFCHENSLILVTADYDSNDLYLFIDDVKRYVLRILAKNETLAMGVGRKTQSIRCLYKSYDQSKSIAKLQTNKKIDSDTLFYSDMGIYQLFLGIEDRSIPEEFCKRHLRPLIEYDKENNSDLYDITKSYLSHNGSVKDTANELYVHRNTINYKLKKVEELLNVDLSSLAVRVQLAIAFMLADMA